MLSNTDNNMTKDLGGAVMGGVFILVASFALWDTTSMIDSDSYVFPRAIAIAMILFSIQLICWNLIRPSKLDETHQRGSTVRRTLLVAVMLLTCIAMPWLGFLLSGILSFGLLMIVSMYEVWTIKRRIIYPLLAAAIVYGFYTLFSELLLVPLPLGQLFE